MSAPTDHRQVPALDRLLDAAKRQTRTTLVRVGRELRDARVTRGMSQSFVAQAAGISQPQLSRLERGVLSGASLDTINRVAKVLGLDASLKLFPGGEPVRDKAHAALLARFQKEVGERWHWHAEVPLPVPGDKRASDRLLRGVVTIGVEGETRPTDMQELQRRLGLKKRDGQVDRLILLLADTEWCRRMIRLNDIETMFPVPGRVALRALAEGRDPGGDAIVLA